jgi:hypothetical protein
MHGPHAVCIALLCEPAGHGVQDALAAGLVALPVQGMQVPPVTLN